MCYDLTKRHSPKGGAPNPERKRLGQILPGVLTNCGLGGETPPKLAGEDARATAAPPDARGHGYVRCLCQAPRVSAQLLADDQVKAGPDPADRADFYVHESKRQGQFSNGILGNIRGHFGSVFRPGYPYGTVSSHGVTQRFEVLLQLQLLGVSMPVSTLNSKIDARNAQGNPGNGNVSLVRSNLRDKLDRRNPKQPKKQKCPGI